MMLPSRTVTVILVAGIAGILAITVLGCFSPTGRDSTETAPKLIPLQEVYSTSDQGELNCVRLRFDEHYDADLEDIFGSLRGEEEAMVFLVRAADFTAAIKATRSVVADGVSADSPPGPPADEPSSQFWLVAYLGSAHSGPPAWEIQAIEKRETSLRVVFRQPEIVTATTDVHPYLVWAPVGSLAPRDYSLQLFDDDRKEVTTARVGKVGEELVGLREK